MAFVWNKQVTSYKADVFAASTLNYTRGLRLTLDDGDDVSIEFPGAKPDDFVDIGTSFHTVQLPASMYDDLYHLLQTEKPVYFTAFDTGGASPVRYAGLSTSAESLGEGLVDSDA